jgi:cobyrinic acid a,c-diamide synthase
VASGPAFSFTYPDNLEALTAAGAELVPVDPLRDDRLPEGVSGLVAGGGFPEVYAEQLAQNELLLGHVRERVRRGMVTWAECGGLLWLCRSLDGHPMAGAVPADARMGDRLSLGYRTATTGRPTPLGPAGTVLRGHEFHYSSTDPQGDLLSLVGRHGSGTGGFGHERLFASYLHVHLGARPDLAERFVGRCRDALPVPYAS